MLLDTGESMGITKFCIFIILVMTVFSCISFAVGNRTGEYKIGSGDIVSITILGHGDYKFNEVKTVTPTGKILISIMQEEFTIGGKTVDEAAKAMEAILAKDYLNEPHVIIEVTSFNSQKVLIIGELKQPGEVTLQNANPRLKDLIIQAGGPLGGMNKMVVVVSEDQKSSEDTRSFSLDELLLSNKYDAVTVTDGDIIYVLGSDKQMPISDMENTIYVFGQVGTPGIISYSRNMTVLRAIISAGNFTSAAAPGRTSVKRLENGKINTISVDLDKVMSGGDKSKDIQLKPGDVIFVPKAIF